MKNLLLGFVLVFLAFNNANSTILTQQQNQTVDGQDFNFNFSITDYAIGTSSTISVTTVGDFAQYDGTIPQSDEWWNLIIEGVDQGVVNPTSSGVYNLINTGTNAISFSIDYILSAAQTNALLVDNMLSLIVDFSYGVNVSYGMQAQQTLGFPRTVVSFDYQAQSVPEPTSLALLGLGLAGFGFSRKKKKA